MIQDAKKGKLGSMSDAVVNANRKLLGVTSEQEDCLKAFTRCKSLVLWVQEKLKGREPKN